MKGALLSRFGILHRTKSRCLNHDSCQEIPVALSPNLMPHAVCWAAAPRLVWTMVVANFITFAAYVSICGTLLYIARRTVRVMARDWIFFVIGFALFIVACGSTHLMDVVTTWIPVFWIDAISVIITAILSGYVAIQLIRRGAALRRFRHQRLLRPAIAHAAGKRRDAR